MKKEILWSHVALLVGYLILVSRPETGNWYSLRFSAVLNWHIHNIRTFLKKRKPFVVVGLILVLVFLGFPITGHSAWLDPDWSNRSGQGWVNDYNSVQFVSIFENAGFRCDYTEEWQSQVIYKFTRKN